VQNLITAPVMPEARQTNDRCANRKRRAYTLPFPLITLIAVIHP